MSTKLSMGEHVAGARLVAAREFTAGLDSGVAWTAAIAFTLLANSIFMNDFFLAGVVDMGPYFDQQPLLLCVFLPALSMGLWAEERRRRTLEFLLTLPLTPGQAALGKYLAVLALFALFALGSAPIPVMLGFLGSPDWGLVLSGYLGVALVAAALLALGSFFSALASNQLTAFLASTLACLFLVLTGRPEVIAILDGLFPAVHLGTSLAGSVSILPRFEELSRGVIATSNLVWFAGFSALFLWATTLVLERHRD